MEYVLTEEDRVVDRVHSYFGMRKVSIQKGKVLLNNQPIYQRLILDQGYWPDTHLTPASEEVILKDIDAILDRAITVCANIKRSKTRVSLLVRCEGRASVVGGCRDIRIQRRGCGSLYPGMAGNRAAAVQPSLHRDVGAV